MHHQRLIGRTAIVTGAGRGIGRAIARAYAHEGARVALVSRTSEELEQLATEIRTAGGDALCFTCDVRDSAAVNNVVDAVVAQWGTIDALVNAAGIPMVSPTVELHPIFGNRMGTARRPCELHFARVDSYPAPR